MIHRGEIFKGEHPAAVQNPNLFADWPATEAELTLIANGIERHAQSPF